MLATNERSLNDLTTCEAVITVQGWLMDNGSLWINNLRIPVTIDSPMLVPVNPFNLLLRGVKHMQSSENGLDHGADAVASRMGWATIGRSPALPGSCNSRS